MTSLLVTNDFPPKHGGIQTYLHELWRRLPPEETVVLTTPFAGADAFDAAQPFRVERTRDRVLFPVPWIRDRIDALAREIDASVVFLDPMLPLGLVGRRLRSAPHVVVAHGAEITLPGRVPGSNLAARSVLRGAAGIVAAGHYPAAVAAQVAGRPLRGVEIPPGVDPARFRPLEPDARVATRAAYGLPADRPVVLGLSRLVPRKGFDVLLDAATRLDPDVVVAIGGAGRDRTRLEHRADRLGIRERVVFLGRVPDADLPAVYASADVFAMLCRERWAGLEAEGFGIVFLEAAACGVPAVAGRSGGSHEAVDDGVTGCVVDPTDVGEIAAALERLLGDDALRARMGAQARHRAETVHAYDVLVERLRPVARGELDRLGTIGSPR